MLTGRTPHATATSGVAAGIVLSSRAAGADRPQVCRGGSIWEWGHGSPARSRGGSPVLGSSSTVADAEPTTGSSRPDDGSGAGQSSASRHDAWRRCCSWRAKLFVRGATVAARWWPAPSDGSSPRSPSTPSSSTPPSSPVPPPSARSPTVPAPADADDDDQGGGSGQETGGGGNGSSGGGNGEDEAGGGDDSNGHGEEQDGDDSSDVQRRDVPRHESADGSEIHDEHHVDITGEEPPVSLFQGNHLLRLCAIEHQFPYSVPFRCFFCMENTILRLGDQHLEYTNMSLTIV
uniref:Uncharacterized protein n=1 Tax=Oryza meridionalis TaxID=40149 RepID=A0A0E0DWW5_9ORYZ